MTAAYRGALRDLHEPRDVACDPVPELLRHIQTDLVKELLVLLEFDVEALSVPIDKLNGDTFHHLCPYFTH